MREPQRVLLVILDGWGHTDFQGPPDPGNAIRQARVPVFRELLGSRSHGRLRCSGEEVGLPEGQMGNSEVGHLNLGAGRVVYQDLARIDRAIREGELAEALRLDAVAGALRTLGGALHLVGLVSDGGVHSHIRHLQALLEAIPPDVEVVLHCITDGRDTSPTSGEGHLEVLDGWCRERSNCRIGTVTGRYFAMDRDRRWERTERAYRAIALGEAEESATDLTFVRRCYERGITDEFLPPTVMEGYRGRGIQPEDALLFFNFRSDRMRQLVPALGLESFDAFSRSAPLPGLVVTLTRYEEGLPVEVAFPPNDLAEVLSQVVSREGLGQLKVAETEKYAHVTYFFNGGREEPFPGEERVLIPSPRVATYDLQPEMSAAGVGAAVVKGLRSGAHHFILVNFANPDMVGHTGSIPAARAAVEAVDLELGRILAVAKEEGWWVLVTADHGNAEKMLQEDGSPHTAHTTEPVDMIVVAPGEAEADGEAGAVPEDRRLREGKLADVAPTVLHLMGIPQPGEMTGRVLFRDPAVPAG